ncbi:MAG: alanine--tRNA ligase [Bacilli bacterium]|nr:alanine--tRNA ligase [Bacilli bacterium]
MKKMTHNEIRNMWFNFFKSHGHKVIDSAPLIPINDDTLLWVNAGVTPLKKYFDGTIVPDCKRLTSIQKCIRTNDIENVGITRRHQTFFEMMGNFSIGDYFKNEAIEYSYELLTSEKWFGIPKERLYVTVYTYDSDAYNKWIEVGMDPSHIIKLDDNFWEIGAGPCGPDSEIFYDRGEKYDPLGDAFSKFKSDDEQERYVEIWNNVFSQFNQEEGLERKDYKELPHKNIDTGAGLERWCMIFQDVDSNFETDLFMPIIEAIEKITNVKYQGQTPIKVIADHIRTITFALSDGAYFDNSGRGYVLRRLLRRSERYGRTMGLKEPFMYKLVSAVVENMKDAYPYLLERRADVEVLVLEEEKLFLKTLGEGERILKELVKNSTDGTISGADSFRLYDTYGFPFELTLEYLNELGYTTDKGEFDKYMNAQKEMARRANINTTKMASQKEVLLNFKDESTFVYGIYRLKTSVLAIFSKDSIVPEINHDGYIALDRTCFYALSGGQVSDTGMIIGKNFKARVLDVFKGPNGQHIHKVKLLDGVIHEKDECELVLDKERRKMIEQNHSSVHLLHYALRTLLEGDVHQAGSYVDSEKLRLDFTYSKKLTDEKVVEVENMVNDLIKKGTIVSTEIMPLDKAREIGAMALFSEKYGDMVRVVKIGKSIELCGGTHTTNTLNIKRFAIYSYENKGTNVYRIEGCTGDKIEDTLYNTVKPYNDETIKLLMKAKSILDEAKKKNIDLEFDVDIDNTDLLGYESIIFNQNRLSYVQSEVRELEKKYLKKIEENTLNDLEKYRSNVKVYTSINGLIMEVNNMDLNILKSIADTLVNEMKPGCVFFINKKDDGSVNYVCRSNSFVNAGLVVKDASISSGGNGGGSSTFAQGGGRNTELLNEIKAHLEKVFNNEK